MKTALFVIFCHLFMILWVTFSSLNAPKPLRSPLTVKTYVLPPAEAKKAPPAPVAARATPKQPPVQAPPKIVKKEEPKPKPVAPAKVVTKKAPEEKKPHPQKQELLHLMQKSLEYSRSCKK